MDRDQIQEIVFEAIEQVNFEHGPDEQIPIALDTVLSGKNAVPDSLGLLSILMSVEEALRDAGHSLNLADDAAVEAHPWTTVERLIDYVAGRLA